MSSLAALAFELCVVGGSHIDTGHGEDQRSHMDMGHGEDQRERPQLLSGGRSLFG